MEAVSERESKSKKRKKKKNKKMSSSTTSTKKRTKKKENKSKKSKKTKKSKQSTPKKRSQEKDVKCTVEEIDIILDELEENEKKQSNVVNANANVIANDDDISWHDILNGIRSKNVNYIKNLISSKQLAVNSH
eukprot:14041_1